MLNGTYGSFGEYKIHELQVNYPTANEEVKSVSYIEILSNQVYIYIIRNIIIKIRYDFE